jgi:hypothetical protein
VRLRCAGLLAPLAMLSLSPAPAAAQPRILYPPVPYQYPYRYAGPESNLRLAIKPKQAAVYVDGYFAGQVDQYDGVFQRLHVTPGNHEIVIYLQGFRSIHERLYLAPNATRKISARMEPLAPGEPNDPIPVPPSPPPADTSQGQMPPPPPFPRRGPPVPYPPLPPDRGPEPSGRPGPAGPSSTVGTVSIRVQPAGTEILIDGERWRGPAREDERLIVQLSEGPHAIEVHRPGYRDFSTQVDVRRDETTPVNISLTPER